MTHTGFWGYGPLSIFSLSRVYDIYMVHETRDEWLLHPYAVMLKMNVRVLHLCDKIKTGIYNKSEIKRTEDKQNREASAGFANHFIYHLLILPVWKPKGKYEVCSMLWRIINTAYFAPYGLSQTPIKSCQNQAIYKLLSEHMLHYGMIRKIFSWLEERKLLHLKSKTINHQKSYR